MKESPGSSSLSSSSSSSISSSSSSSNSGGGSVTITKTAPPTKSVVVTDFNTGASVTTRGSGGKITSQTYHSNPRGGRSYGGGGGSPRSSGGNSRTQTQALNLANRKSGLVSQTSSRNSVKQNNIRKDLSTSGTDTEMGLTNLQKYQASKVVKNQFGGYSPVSSSGKVLDRKSTRLNSSHIPLSRMPSSA